MNEKLLSLLGIARRAGRLSLGFDAAADAMKNGKASLLLLAADLSARSAGSIAYIAEQAGVPVTTTDATMEQLGNAIGKRQTGIISVNDSGFATKINTLCAEKQTGGMVV